MFSDKQHIKMQETPETVPDGETPQTLQMCAYEDLVDFVKPGDRVEVVGIFRAVGNRVNAGMRTLKNIYRTHIDVIGYKKTESKRYENDDEAGDQKSQDQAMNDDGDLDQEADGDHEEGLGDDRQMQYTQEQVRKFKELGANP